ncbi:MULTISPECIES: nucleotidyltransferase domain-containing protein [Pseudomonas]|uniref:Nucleotidyltransferase domain-containing protein n=1 Tax=Pseudomonas phytophila TaxID=2867264 RepID=A0ABY6FB57_9PSED|nr:MULTISPECIES: nucleotidyltransferase domain-containing protein [Pseudomonas]MCD5991599.1 nucleotidyltransferase domain-containing protein [Pseudomonas quasicaspiana]MDU8362426.1 nucleotidyltransferase domain-containing protein [Pseudomonas syringae group sp. J309-1]UXZ95127.1 nucleotidyltransferase domain-containing protein [Pseudomonas phytophila]
MDLASFLFSEYRRKVLALLLLHPGEQYHQREIARQTGTISGTLSRELNKMVEVGILKKIRVGNQVQYRADPGCPIYEELASILRKTDGWLQSLSVVLQPLEDRIKAAFVFGSMASGKAGPDSDIDLMVIGDVTFSELISLLYPLQETLGREINPKQYPDNEWFQLVKEQGGFVRDLLSKPKLFVIGAEEDLDATHRE